MKKQALIGLSLFLIGGLTLTAGVRIEAKGSYFSSENSTFRDVYGGTPKLGLEAGIEVAKNISIWVGADYVHKAGKLTVTQDETKVTIIPLGAGARYEIPAGTKLQFHIAAGVQEVIFKEENVIGTVKTNAFGFIAAAGGVFRLTKAVGIDLFVGWSTCKMTNQGLDFKVGGLDAGGGIEVRF
jgi:hypothetical protein